MKIKWLGHASFLIKSDKGITIITDPYNVYGGIQYSPINESADIVTISHGHGDHNNSKAIQGNPAVITAAGTREIKGITVRGFNSYHDDEQGSKRGSNIMFCFTVDSINICHCGDLGHTLSQNQLSDIGPIDIILVPVGGNFTVNAGQAAEVIRLIKPKVIIPMHYKNEKCSLPISTLEEFTKGKNNVRELSSNEIEFTMGSLPQKTEIIVLQYKK